MTTKQQFVGLGYYSTETDTVVGQFSSCCGSNFARTESQLKNFTKTYRGIKLALGEVVKPSVNDKSNYYVVKTKNGPVSIAIRHTW